MRVTREQQLFTRALTSALGAPGTVFFACARATMRRLWRLHRGDVGAIAAHLGTSVRSVQRSLVTSGVRPRNDTRVNKRYRPRSRRARR